MTWKKEERKAKGDARATVAVTESTWKRRPDMCLGSGVYARDMVGVKVVELWRCG